MRRLADVAEVRLGRQRSPARAEGPNMRPYMRAANVSWAGLDISDVKEMDFSPEEFEVFGLRNGDVLVGEASGSPLEVGKSAIWRDEVPGSCFQNTLIRVRCGPELLPEYLQKHLLHDARSGALARIAKGIGIHHLGAQGLANWHVAVPPLDEQQRIAGKLDALLVRVDACRQRLDGLPVALQRLRQSVLRAAATGRLTADWREKRAVAPPRSATVGEVLTVSSGDFLTARQMVSTGTIPVFGGNGINGYHDRSNVEQETLVIGRVGFYCGSIHLTPSAAWVTDNALIVQHDEATILRRFLYFALQAIDLRTNDSSTAQPVISARKIYPISIVVPHLIEQMEIVRRASEAIAVIDEAERRCANAQSLRASLHASVLARAFRGDLVPQDPTDEPADAPLARLRAAAPEASPGVAPSRRSKASAAPRR